jgi:cell division protein DivIC
MQQSPTQQQPKRASKAPARRMRLAVIVMLCVMAPIAMAAWNQYGQLRENTSQLNELKAKVDDKNKANQEIKQELDRLKDPEYRQEKIRKQLNVAKDGETVFDSPKAP